MAIVADTSLAGALFEAVPDGATRVASGAPWLRRILVAGDAVALCAAWTLAYVAVGSSGGALDSTPLKIAIMAIAGLSLLHVERLYLGRVASMRSVELAGIARASFVMVVVAVVVERLLTDDVLLSTASLGAGASLVALALWRTAYRGWLRAQRQEGRFCRDVVLVGIDDQTRDLHDLLRDHPELGFRVAGVVGDRRAATQIGLDEMWLGPIGEAAPLVAGQSATGAIVLATALDADDMNATVRALLDSDCHVHISSGVRGIDHRRLQSVHVGYEPLVYVERSALTTRQMATKRVLDIVVSGLALIAVAPVIGVAAALIKLNDRGPVVFRQTRVGRDGKHFTVFKLRTMTVDAEQRLAALLDRNERDGPLFKMTDDPRVTKFGGFIRAFNIDELPQLWNVLRGDMSLVGPRPALPSEVELFDSRLQARTNVLPGITGLWQVEARDNPSFQSYARLDMFYVENWSLTLDLTILLSTIETELGRLMKRVILRQDDGPTPRPKLELATAPPEA